MALRIKGDLVIVRRVGDIDPHVDALLRQVTSRWSQTKVDGDLVYMPMPPGAKNEELIQAISAARGKPVTTRETV